MPVPPAVAKFPQRKTQPSFPSTHPAIGVPPGLFPAEFPRLYFFNMLLDELKAEAGSQRLATYCGFTAKTRTLAAYSFTS